jgi:myosin heavy subunit
MSTQPTTGGHDHGHHDEHAAPAAHASPVVSDNDELDGIKMVALESAELATRSANLAVGAGENMKKATHNLEELMKLNKKQHQILLAIACGLMFITALVFATSIFSLKSRITQMDTMLGALSKRVVELNDTIELVSSVNEGLQEMVSKQDDMTKMQSALETRLADAIKKAESVPERTAQQVGEKGQVLADQVKALESRFVQQSRAMNALASQVTGLKGAVGETGGFKKEMEKLASLQKERQAADNMVAAKAAANNNAANQAALNAVKQREKMVQYPRAQQETTPVGTGGVLSSKP